MNILSLKSKLKKGQKLIYACSENPRSLYRFIDDLRKTCEQSPSGEDIISIKIEKPNAVFSNVFSALIITDDNKIRQFLASLQSAIKWSLDEMAEIFYEYWGVILSALGTVICLATTADILIPVCTGLLPVIMLAIFCAGTIGRLGFKNCPEITLKYINYDKRSIKSGDVRYGCLNEKGIWR